MKIHIGSDHAGLEFKNKIVEHLKAQGHTVEDHGPHVYDALDDYPVFCIPAAEATASEPGSFGIALGGSGNGEQMEQIKSKAFALHWYGVLKLRSSHANTMTRT